MTTEELLKPRYKVIADYPNSPYGVNMVIGKREIMFGMGELSPENYPSIFIKLEWFQERNLNEIPQYLKFKVDGEICKIAKQAEATPSDVYCQRVNDRMGTYYQWLSLYDLLPATLEDYERYLKTRQ